MALAIVAVVGTVNYAFLRYVQNTPTMRPGTAFLIGQAVCVAAYIAQEVML